MNHTIKGILIVAAITSMLVVGASMVPIMQNSFAHKKERNNQERGNANVNENTVTGTTSSDATVTNTNTINNTNTQSQNQGQNACLLAGECTADSTETETGG